VYFSFIRFRIKSPPNPACDFHRTRLSTDLNFTWYTCLQFLLAVNIIKICSAYIPGPLCLQFSCMYFHMTGSTYRCLQFVFYFDLFFVPYLFLRVYLPASVSLLFKGLLWCISTLSCVPEIIHGLSKLLVVLRLYLNASMSYGRIALHFIFAKFVCSAFLLKISVYVILKFYLLP
jgi:hypothetical protein